MRKYIFRNFIPHNIIKLNYKYPTWMNPRIILSQKHRSILTKRQYCNPTEECKHFSTARSNDCSNMIIKAKGTIAN